jgi:transposase
MYILGARLKNEPEAIRELVLSQSLTSGQTACISKEEGRKLVVHYSVKRAKKDAYNRKRGLERLEKKVRHGRLSKSNINNRGYNKYLKLTGEITVAIDYGKYEADAQWDGLKGFITNTALEEQDVVESYGCLWYVERAFRMSKTDLAIRPVYHRLRERIEAHICIAFVAYTVYKELERVLLLEKAQLSLKKASEITHNIYQVTFTLPESKQTKTKLLNMDDQQQLLFDIVQKYFRVSQR